MKLKIYIALLAAIYSSILGCGSSTNTDTTNTNTSESVGKDIVTANNLQVEGQPTTTTLELPLQFTGANWGLKEGLCQQAGYDLVPFAGQTVSLIQYSITEKYSGEPLYLWVIAKDKTSICGYLTVREGSGLIPGVMAVNNSNVR